MPWNLVWMVSAILLAGCGSGVESDTAGDGGAAAEAAAQGSVVRLTPEKIAAAKIHTTPCEPRQMDFSRRVAGHLDYDSARRLELRAPAFCVVKEVLVAPSQTVKKGDPLLVLSSAEVGLARDEVQKREADLKLAKLHSEWSNEVAGNVRDALAYLDQQPSMDELQQRFQGKRLGEYRDALLAAWSRLQLAQRTAASSEDMREQGLLSARTDQERRSQLEVAQAEFRSACEQAERDVAIQTGKAQADVEQAQRLLQVSREKLQALLQPFADHVDAVSGAINELTLRAPFDGQVQQRHVVPAMQVPEGQAMLELANTDELWVSAQIQERHWSALSVEPGQMLTVESPALPGREFSARVKFIGAAVSAANRTLPLVCELDNPERLFKPGMFVWVTVPLAKPRTVLAVSPASLLHHDGKAFVFVAEGPETFRRVEVETGAETTRWVEITAGLTAGQAVVDAGAFYLKSELLLEREVE